MFVAGCDLMSVCTKEIFTYCCQADTLSETFSNVRRKTGLSTRTVVMVTNVDILPSEQGRIS